MYLLLESPLGCEGAIPGLPLPAPSQPSQPAHRGGSEADPGYAPPQPGPGHGGAVIPAAEAELYPTSVEPVLSHA